MASVNKVILIGNLGQAPDVRITNSGIKVAEISIATSSYFNRDNERVEKTTWHTVTLWNKLAEIVEQWIFLIISAGFSQISVSVL